MAAIPPKLDEQAAIEELVPSQLGTKEYWDDVYQQELEDFRDSGDTGEVWFGHQAQNRVVQWLEKSVDNAASVLDIGCGNGALLVALAEKGFVNLIGVDYAQSAIDLAQSVAKEEGYSISFTVMDVCSAEQPVLRGAPFDVCLDKGTYDAISLTADSKLRKECYTAMVQRHLKEGGFFVIASCNWTKQELIQLFPCFNYVSDIPAPSISFGGRSGQTVTTVVFVKC